MGGCRPPTARSTPRWPPAWYTELGGLNKWVHIWPYSDLEERNRVREEAVKSPHWPPPHPRVPAKPGKQDNGAGRLLAHPLGRQ